MPLCSAYESFRLLHVPKPPVLAYYFGFTLRISRRGLLFRVAVSDSHLNIIIAFILSALFGALPTLLKAFAEAASLPSKGVLLPIHNLIQRLVDDIKFFMSICQCFLKYR